MDSSNQKYKSKHKNKQNGRNKTTTSEEKKDEKDIFDYFILGEDENNVIITSNLSPKEKSEEKSEEENQDNNNENNTRIKYNVNSFISSNFRPDLYSPLGIIAGNKYNLRRNSLPGKEKVESEEIELEEKEDDKIEENDNEEKEEKEEKEEEEEKESKMTEEKIDNVKKELDKYKLLKIGRYYNLEEDITVKCHNCGEIGHIKDLCPYTNLKFCHRCLSYNHNDKDCKNKKCFRCNRSGHNKNECSLKESEILICYNCENSGHRKNECLIKPAPINSKIIKNNGLSCFYCGNQNHLICPLSERKDIILKGESIDFNELDEDMDCISSQEMSSDTPVEEDEEMEITKKKKKKKKKAKQIFDDIKNEDIKYTIFCGYCGERHRNENCPDKDELKFSNDFDNFRKNISKKILDRRNKENEEDQRYNSFLRKRQREESSNSNNRNDNRKQQRDNMNKNNEKRNIFNSKENKSNNNRYKKK